MHSIKASISLNGNLYMPSNRGRNGLFSHSGSELMFSCWRGAACCSDHMDGKVRCQGEPTLGFWPAEWSSAPSRLGGPLAD